MAESGYMHRNALGWLVTIPIVAVENIIALIIISSRKRWKSPDVLLFSITLGHVLSLLLPLLLYAVIVYKKEEWTDGACKFLVWCVMSFRIVGAINIAFISLDRVWTLKWSSSYRAHNSARQTARTAVFMWLFGVAIGTIPLISWINLEEDGSSGSCSLVLNIAGYGYAMCIVSILLGSVIVSSVCIATIVVNVVCIWPLLEEVHDPKASIPQIVIESETGERTSAVPGSRDSQNQQIYLLVSAVVALYFCFNGLPFVVINIIAFTQTNPSNWMSVSIEWCGIVTASLHPPLLVLICNRYRKVCLRLYRWCGETYGCMTPPPAKQTFNGIVRQETFDSLDDFSSEEDDKLHFPAPDWSDSSFTGSLDEGAGPSSEDGASTSTAVQTAAVEEPSQPVKNGNIPSLEREKVIEYDNEAFEVDDENKRVKVKRQRSPRLTPEQKRAMWQGHKGAKKRLQAIKQANAERATSSKSSKGKKSKSRSEKHSESKTLRVDSPAKNHHKKLERLSTKQHSLDSLTIPTKQKVPFTSSRSLDQEVNTLTVRVDIENENAKQSGSDSSLDEKKKIKKQSKSESSSSQHGNPKRRVPNGRAHSENNASVPKKELVAIKQKREAKMSSSPNHSPDRREKRGLPENSLHKNPRFELTRENCNSDFSSFGSGELYDIPEESPEEIQGESSGWNKSTVRALKAQHKDEVSSKEKHHQVSEKRLAQRKQREKQRLINASDQKSAEKTNHSQERKPPRRMLSRQLSQDHSRSLELNSIEMTDFEKSKDSAISLSVEEQERETPRSIVHIDYNDDLEEHQLTYYIAKDLKPTKDIAEDHNGIKAVLQVENDEPADLKPFKKSDIGDQSKLEEESPIEIHDLSQKNADPVEFEGSADGRRRLNKSKSDGGTRPSAKDLRERYKKSHLSMAAIFESIRDDSQEVVYL